MNANCNDIFHVLGGWRYMLEAYNSVSFRKFSYIILNNNLLGDMDYRIYSQIFQDEQLVVFKKLKADFK